MLVVVVVVVVVVDVVDVGGDDVVRVESVTI